MTAINNTHNTQSPQAAPELGQERLEAGENAVREFSRAMKKDTPADGERRDAASAAPSTEQKAESPLLTPSRPETRRDAATLGGDRAPETVSARPDRVSREQAGEKGTRLQSEDGAPPEEQKTTFAFRPAPGPRPQTSTQVPGQASGQASTQAPDQVSGQVLPQVSGQGSVQAPAHGAAPTLVSGQTPIAARDSAYVPGQTSDRTRGSAHASGGPQTRARVPGETPLQPQTLSQIPAPGAGRDAVLPVGTAHDAERGPAGTQAQPRNQGRPLTNPEDFHASRPLETRGNDASLGASVFSVLNRADAKKTASEQRDGKTLGEDIVATPRGDAVLAGVASPGGTVSAAGPAAPAEAGAPRIDADMAVRLAERILVSAADAKGDAEARITLREDVLPGTEVRITRQADGGVSVQFVTGDARAEQMLGSHRLGDLQQMLAQSLQAEVRVTTVRPDGSMSADSGTGGRQDSQSQGQGGQDGQPRDGRSRQHDLFDGLGEDLV